MAAILQLRQGSTSTYISQGSNIAEPFFDTDSNVLVVGKSASSVITLAKLDESNAGSLSITGEVTASIFSGSLDYDYLTNIPAGLDSIVGSSGILSSSQQISNLGFNSYSGWTVWNEFNNQGVASNSAVQFIGNSLQYPTKGDAIDIDLDSVYDAGYGYAIPILNFSLDTGSAHFTGGVAAAGAPAGTVSGSSQVQSLLPSGITSGSAIFTDGADLVSIGITTTTVGDLGSGNQLSLYGASTTSGLLSFDVGGTAKSFDYVSSNVRYLDSNSGVSIAIKPDATATKAWVFDTDGDLVSNAGSWNSGAVYADRLIAKTEITGSNLTLTGAIQGGAWNGSIIGTDYLDSDTAHLSGVQSFIGAKTFGAITHVGNSTASTNKTNGALTVAGGVGISGALNVGGDIVAFSTSDKRLKDKIIPIKNPLEKINSIGGYSFLWNSSKQDIYSGKDYGVIAQEIEEILPELVDTRENGYKAVKYDKLVSLLIEGIKELSQEVNVLKEKINRE